MKCAFWFGIVAYLVASVQIVGAQTPSGDSEWSTIRLQRGHGVEIKTSTGTRRGQLVRVDRDDLVISSVPEPRR
jgi:hypothetical protein